jgi:hypothetical protein
LPADSPKESAFPSDLEWSLAGSGHAASQPQKHNNRGAIRKASERADDFRTTEKDVSGGLNPLHQAEQKAAINLASRRHLFA